MGGGKQQDIIDAFNEQARRNERAANERHIREYVAVQKHLLSELGKLQEAIQDALDNGLDITPGWLYQQSRYKSLIAQTSKELDRLRTSLGPSIQGAKQQGVELATLQARAMTAASLLDKAPLANKGVVAKVMARFDNLPKSTITSLVGGFTKGSPLFDLLSQNGVDTVKGVKSALLLGIATGEPIKRVARGVELALGGSLSRALTISRTETFRAMREATRLTYDANSDIVDRWEWRCARTAETCAVCWAMDGQVFDVDTSMAAHVNCRCVMVPKTKTWEELGFKGLGETASPLLPGQDAFDNLSEADQLRILGPSKYEAFTSGKLDLSDLVGYRKDPDWGGNVYERGLGDALEASGPGLRGNG
jgi:hypothetical protein